ncbi:MAG: discoidin domain-containing protein [Planctomycetota bacterium]
MLERDSRQCRHGQSCLGAKATASSTSKYGGPPEAAIDGDPNSMWWSDKDQPDPQWLMVDLGVERTVGGVGVASWKAYAKDYTVEVSTDARSWHEAARVEGRSNWLGDMDVLRVKSIPARYVRLHCTTPAVTWQDHTVYEFGVYESIPE